VLPANLYNNEEGLVLHSYLRATYGGFVVSEEVGTMEALEIIDLVVQRARQLGVKEIIIRNPFRIFNERLCDETDYAMWYHGFKIKYRDLETAIQLTNYEYASSFYTDSTSRNIKKSKRNLSVIVSNDF